MVRKRFDVEVPDGNHLAFSRDTDGAYRAHLFSDESNELVGHAELFAPDENEADSPNVEYVYVSNLNTEEDQDLTPEELAEAILVLVRLGIIVTALAVRAAPHVKKWWHTTAASAIKAAGNKAALSARSTWSTLVKLRKVEHSSAPAESVHDTDFARGGPSTELEVAFKDYQARMSSTEARQRFVMALLAKAFSEEQMRLLHDSRVEDDDDPSGLRAAMAGLTQDQVGETITLMLEKNPSLLDPGSLAELETILGANSGTGERVALRIGAARETPRSIARRNGLN